MKIADKGKMISAYAFYKQELEASKKKKNKRNKRKLPVSNVISEPLSKKVKQAGKAQKLKKPQPKSMEGDTEDTIPTLVDLPPPAGSSNGIKIIVPRDEDDPITEALKLFKWLIHPITPEKFLNDNWEKKWLHIKRGHPRYYSHILNSKTLDRIFRDNLLHYTRNVDVVTYENDVKEVHNQEGRAVPSALWDFYANGCSIRLLNPQTYNNKVHLMLATLQEYFGTMVGANVYLTPPGSQGFAPHFDDIEAFVIQLEGRKHWKLYQPKKSDVLARDSSPNFTRNDIGKPFAELTLEAGDVLFFPRGTIHEGRTDNDHHSLHITISVYQHTAYVDLLENVLPSALRRISSNNVEFRKGLPLNYLKHLGRANENLKTKERASAMQKVQNLLKTCFNQITSSDIDFGADQLGRKFMHDSMPPVPNSDETGRSSKGNGDFLSDGQVLGRVEISLDTDVRLLRYHCVRLVIENESNVKLYYNTENAKVYHGEEEQWLELEPNMADAIRALQSVYPNYVKVEDLPLDDVAMKIQLVSDLWEHGLLVTERPLESEDSDESVVSDDSS